VRSLRDNTRGLSLQKSKQTWRREAYFVKLCFRQCIKLFSVSVIFDFENIHPSGNFKGKYPFKPLCWNVNTNCDKLMLRSIAPAISLKTAGKYYSSGFLLSFSLVSLAPGYLYYSSFTAYASNNNRERENTIRGLFGIAGFTDQRTTFTRAQSAIL